LEVMGEMAGMDAVEEEEVAEQREVRVEMEVTVLL
jgi:hypothetical protein